MPDLADKEAHAVARGRSGGQGRNHSHCQPTERAEVGPPHLVRRPVEPVDQRLQQFYDRLLTALKLPAVRDGGWQLLECGPTNQGQCYVALPFGNLAGAEWRLADQIEGAVDDRDGGDLQHRGWYVDTTRWQASVFTLIRRASGA